MLASFSWLLSVVALLHANFGHFFHFAKLSVLLTLRIVLLFSYIRYFRQNVKLVWFTYIYVVNRWKLCTEHISIQDKGQSLLHPISIIILRQQWQQSLLYPISITILRQQWQQSLLYPISNNNVTAMTTITPVSNLYNNIATTMTTVTPISNL